MKDVTTAKLLRIHIGELDRAARLLEMLSPVSHARTPEEVAIGAPARGRNSSRAPGTAAPFSSTTRPETVTCA
jgi:hypothetical protein